jgi:hypothetical protein
MNLGKDQSFDLLPGWSEAFQYQATLNVSIGLSTQNTKTNFEGHSRMQ